MATFSGAAKQACQFEESLDRAADEIFTTMMGVPCLPVEGNPVREQEVISAVIGLAGAMSGSLVLHVGSAAAMRMTERMTGAAPKALDAMVRDALGEVCNMMAGAWKGYDAALSSGCLLSTPTVVAGSSYELFSQRASLRIERSYRFDDQVFTMTLFCEHSS